MTDKKKDRPFVFVRCLTFNHEAYIEDALNGFVMQETNFPFVVTIVNDASPDNTRQVLDNYIKENCILENVEHANTDYADIITAIPTQNTNCLLYILNLHENHFGKKSHRPYYQHFVDKAKYWAECDGDDYWINPHKLQKQVDFMEENEDCSLCFHKANTLIQETGEIKDEFIVRDMPGNSSIIDLAKGNYIHMPTVLYRIYPNFNEELQKLSPCMPTDYVMWMLLAEKGKIYKINEPMAVYRYGVGIWSKGWNYNKTMAVLKTLTKLSCVIENPEAKMILKAEVQKLSTEIIDYISNVEKQYNQICSSRAYKLGKCLLNPLKWLRRLFK